MVLTLLVYASLELLIRQGLLEQGQTFPDQKGKPTQRPTARWVLIGFTGIDVFYHGPPDTNSVVLNLKEHHLTILRVLGPHFLNLYG